MAQTTLIPKPYSQREFVENTKKSQKILLNTQTSIVNINNVLKERKEKREKIHSSIIEGKKRREFLSRRQEIEEELESKKIVSAPNISGIINLASRSGKSFIDRIVGSLGYLAAGWVLRNLPTWTAMAQEFIARLQEAGKIIRSFVTGTINIFQSSFRLITSAAENLKNFDLFDSSNKVKDSFGELVRSITDMGGELEAGIKLITTPLTQTTEDGTQVGSYSGQEVPALGSTSEDMGAYSSSSSSSSRSVYGTPEEKALLDAIAFAEGTKSSYGTMFGGGISKDLESGKLTVKQVIDLGDAHAKKNRRSGAAGRYQFMPFTLEDLVRTGDLKMDDKFTPQMQDKAALALARRRKVTSELLKKEGLSAKVSNMLAPEWASLPTYSGASYYSNQSVKSLSSIQSAYKKSLGSPQQAQSQAQTSTSAQASSPQRAVSIGTTQLIPHTGPGGFLQGSSGKGMEDYPRYGVHFHLSPPNTSKDGLEKSRNVAFLAIKAMFARGSSVYLSNINTFVPKDASDSTIKAMILREQIAHSQPGRTQGGIDIQEANPNVGPTHKGLPGSKIAFPFAVGKVSSLSSGSGYGREAEVIGSDGVMLAHGASGSTASNISNSQKMGAQITPAPQPAQTTPPKAQISSTPAQQSRQQMAQSITPDNKPQDIVAIIPEHQTPPKMPQMPPISPPAGPSGSVSMTTVLNNFMKQKLLLELAYV